MARQTIRIHPIKDTVSTELLVPIANIRDVHAVPPNVPIYGEGVRSIVALKGAGAPQYYVADTLDQVEAMINDHEVHIIHIDPR